MGKRKIAIEKLEDPNKRQVTFSKRRKGLFKKAADACFLFESEIAVIVFSPAGKPYTFGHTSVDSLIDRYLTRSSPVTGDNGDEHSRLAREIRDLECQLKKEKQEREIRVRYPWEQIDVEEHDSLEKMESLVDELEKLKNNVLRRLENLHSSVTTSDLNAKGSEDDGDQAVVGVVDCVDDPVVANAGNEYGREDDQWYEEVLAPLLIEDNDQFFLPDFCF